MTHYFFIIDLYHVVDRCAEVEWPNGGDDYLENRDSIRTKFRKWCSYVNPD